jgi:hypothetical protein
MSVVVPRIMDGERCGVSPPAQCDSAPVHRLVRPSNLPRTRARTQYRGTRTRWLPPHLDRFVHHAAVEYEYRPAD